MPHNVEPSLANGVSARRRIGGLCEESKVMMFVLDGLCLLGF